jgi:hypothetical protein
MGMEGLMVLAVCTAVIGVAVVAIGFNTVLLEKRVELLEAKSRRV